MESAQPESQGKASKRKLRPTKWAWLALILIPLAFFLPLIGEQQRETIVGHERYCCMGDSFEEFYAREEKVALAKSRRADSNFIIGSYIVLAIVLTIAATYILYKFAIPSIKLDSARLGAKIIVGIILAALMAILSVTTFNFCIHNDAYYDMENLPPGENIYGLLLIYTLDSK